MFLHVRIHAACDDFGPRRQCVLASSSSLVVSVAMSAIPRVPTGAANPVCSAAVLQFGTQEGKDCIE